MYMPSVVCAFQPHFCIETYKIIGSLIQRLEPILTSGVVWSSHPFNLPTKVYVPVLVCTFRPHFCIETYKIIGSLIQRLEPILSSGLESCC
jgi:hypothetical protein